MQEDLLPFDLPVQPPSIIKVMGIGGGGSNAVNYMFRQGIKDVNFVVCNTDSQALLNSPIPVKIRLGGTLTEGLGAGNKPERGKQAAIESIDEVIKVLSDNTRMVFITAGMGGGTGTGAAPVIAKAAKDLGILTVAIVTLPFRFEGQLRVNQAIEGITELKQYVDSILVINNERLREMFGDLPLSDAFGRADNILSVAAKGIAEIITVPGYINVDFADVRTIMTNSGVAVMTASEAEGDNRAIVAVQTALNSPLLNNSDINGARKILLNISSGDKEATMDEISIINEFVQDATGHTADLIWGNTKDENLGNKIAVTVIATGFDEDDVPELYAKKKIHKTTVKFEESNKKNQDVEFIVENVTPVTNSGNTTNTKKSVEKLFNQSEVGFQVKETENDKKVFSIFDTSEEVEEESSEFDKIFDDEEVNAEAKRNLKRMELLKEKQMNTISTKSENSGKHYKEDIEYIENTPAYIRNKKNIDLKNHSKGTNVSRFSLSEDDEKNVKISENNPYLHDKVD